MVTSFAGDASNPGVVAALYEREITSRRALVREQPSPVEVAFEVFIRGAGRRASTAAMSVVVEADFLLHVDALETKLTDHRGRDDSLLPTEAETLARACTDLAQAYGLHDDVALRRRHTEFVTTVDGVKSAVMARAAAAEGVPT